MKIGILTYHYTCNYGGVLQSYALQQVLRRMGHDVKIIDCVPSYFHTSWKDYVPRKISFKVMRELYVKWSHGNETWKAFDRFREEHLLLTERIDETRLPLLNDRFDTIIAGSDQVWCLSQHFRPIYFLNWEPRFQGRRIGYAPCCSVNTIKEQHVSTVRKALDAFDAISVRNDQTYQFVKDVAGIEAPIVADPAILHDFSEFVQPSPATDQYILTYILGDEIEGGHKNVIRELRRMYGNLPVYAIVSAPNNPQLCPWADKVMYDVSPDEWIDLIAHAACVYTDSFHGTILSAKFNRPFVAYYTHLGRGARFIDLQQRCDLQKNIIRSSSVLSGYSREILNPSEHTQTLMREHADVSFQFLMNSLA